MYFYYLNQKNFFIPKSFLHLICRLTDAMDDPSDQENEIEIISEIVKPQGNNDDTNKLLNQAVIGKLRQQYPGLELAGKKVRVVPSQNGGVIDPSRMKIVNVTRIPLKQVQMPSVRHYPGVTNNNASTSSDKENIPRGGSKKVQDRKGLRASSDQSLFSLSSDGILNSCRDLNMNWIRLDINWNVEISSSALRRAFGADIIDKIINPSPVHRQSDVFDDLPCVGDE